MVSLTVILSNELNPCAYYWDRRANFLRQNPYDIVLILLGNHVAEHEHADINGSVFQPLGSLDDVICSGGGYAS